jgi:hypothetical protein
MCYSKSKIQCITADHAKWQNIHEPTFYAVKQTDKEKLPIFQDMGYSVCQDKHLQKLHGLRKITSSALGQSTTKFYGRTHYIPSKSRIASVTATILSNIIQNTLCNNMPHLLKNAKNLLTLTGFSRSVLNQVRRWKKVKYTQRKEVGMKRTTLYGRILIRFPVPKFHLP